MCKVKGRIAVLKERKELNFLKFWLIQIYEIWLIFKPCGSNTITGILHLFNSFNNNIEVLFKQ